MFTRSLIAVLCLGCFVVWGSTDELPKYKPIDAETIAAYEKLGAKYGGLGENKYGFIEFSQTKDALAKRLPGFRISPSSKGILPKLPPVQVPFGLDLRCAVPIRHVDDRRGIEGNQRFQEP